MFFIFREPKIKNTYVLLAPISRTINVFFLCFFVSFFSRGYPEDKTTRKLLITKQWKQICVFNSESPKSLKHVCVCYSWKPNVKNTYVFLLRWNNVPGKNIFWFFLLVTSSAVAFLKPWKKKFRFMVPENQKKSIQPNHSYNTTK